MGMLVSLATKKKSSPAQPAAKKKNINNYSNPKQKYSTARYVSKTSTPKKDSTIVTSAIPTIARKSLTNIKICNAGNAGKMTMGKWLSASRMLRKIEMMGSVEMVTRLFVKTIKVGLGREMLIRSWNWLVIGICVRIVRLCWRNQSKLRVQRNTL